MAKQSYQYPMSDKFRTIAYVISGGGLLAGLFYGYIHFSETGKFPSFQDEKRQLLVSFLLGALVSLSLYFFNSILDRWVAWRRNYTARFVIGYLSSFVIAGILVWTIGGTFAFLGAKENFWHALKGSDEDLHLKISILLLVALFIYKVVYAMLYSYQHYAVAQIEKLQNERKQLELQFEALKSQISPHYLFNSLNTISSLIFKDLPSAEQFIRRLAQTYQYILSTQHRKYVLLQEEVDFVQSYYYLLRIRFQQQLSVEINLPSGIMVSKIPPLTLQMLVENAVKHNSLSSNKKLFIYITAQDNTYLKVINTKNNVQGADSFRVGLENIRKRYEYFTDKKIEVRDEEKFIVSLPVLLQKTEVVDQKFSA